MGIGSSRRMRRLHSCMTIMGLRKRVIARIRATADVQLLREVDRMLKHASKNSALYITTPE